METKTNKEKIILKNKKRSSSEETVWAKVYECRPGGRSETTGGRICETGRVLSRKWKREGVMDVRSGESKAEEVMVEGIGE